MLERIPVQLSHPKAIRIPQLEKEDNMLEFFVNNWQAIYLVGAFLTLIFATIFLKMRFLSAFFWALLWPLFLVGSIVINLGIKDHPWGVG